MLRCPTLKTVLNLSCLSVGAIALMLFASQLILTDGTELCSTVGQGMDETSIWEGKRQSLHLQQVNHFLVVERLVDELKELKASLERFKRTYVS